MDKIITIAFCALIFSACNVNKQTVALSYLSETGYIEYLNANQKNKPVAVVIPALFNSLLTDEVKKDLSKKYRVALLRFPNDTNIARLQNTDKLMYRLDYYANATEQVKNKFGQIDVLIGEGINANIALQIGTNFVQPELFLINAWYPNIKDVVVNTCYINPGAPCDSLLTYLNIPSAEQLNTLLDDVTKQNVAKVYGNYYSNTWAEFIQFDVSTFLKKYEASIQFVYTTNTGILPHYKAKKWQSGTGHKKNVVLLNKSEFIKKPPLFSN